MNPKVDIYNKFIDVKYNKINIFDLYKNVFGYKGLPFPGVIYKPIKVKIANNEKLLTGMLGVPVVLPIVINNVKLKTEPIITVTGANYIVKTKVAGLDGSVKERISADDYIVSIQGVLVNQDSEDLPEAEMDQIIKLCKLKKSLPVTNRLLQMFGINNIAIERYSFPAVPGQQTMQAYKIDAISDNPVELELREDLL